MPGSGYQEFAHTADWGIHVWAGDVIAFLSTAAEGMFSLLEIRSDSQDEGSLTFEIPASDSLEVLLVDFLNELLYLLEREGLAFDHYKMGIDDGILKGSVSGGRLISQKKEIKAVTFHKLEVVESERGFEARIVFDV